MRDDSGVVAWPDWRLETGGGVTDGGNEGSVLAII